MNSSTRNTSCVQSVSENALTHSYEFSSPPCMLHVQNSSNTPCEAFAPGRSAPKNGKAKSSWSYAPSLNKLLRSPSKSAIGKPSGFADVLHR